MKLLDLILTYKSLFIYPLAAIVLTAFLTRVCIAVFPRIGLMDIPRNRHIHAVPIPRGGGIAFIISFFIINAIFLSDHLNSVNYMHFLHFIPSAIILTITGVIDDRFELPSYVKLFAQIVVGILIYVFGGGIYNLFGFVLPIWIGMPLSVLWIILIINAFNLIDGMDGLAAGIATISSLLLAVWTIINGKDVAGATVLFIFSGCCLGFLRYNFNPAKIFMGDTGSMFIGLFFAYFCSMQISRSMTMTSLLIPLLAVGVPLFDVCLAVWRRTVRRWTQNYKGGIMSGDKDHLHHRILRKTGSQSKAAMELYGITSLLLICGIVYTISKSFLPGALFLIIIFVLFSAIKLASVEIKDSFSLFFRGISRPGSRTLLVSVHPVIDLILLSFAFTFVYYLMLKKFQLPLLPVSVVFLLPFPLLAAFSGIYRTYWFRCGINRYYKIAVLFCLSCLAGLVLICLLRFLDISYGSNLLFQNVERRYLLCAYLLFSLLAAAMVLGERFIIRYLGSFGIRDYFLQTNNTEKLEKIVIIGAGIGCRLYIESLYGRYFFNRPFEIAGIVDENTSLKGFNVFGFNVLGNIGQLDYLLKKYKFDKIVVTECAIGRKELQKISNFCLKNNIKTSYFRACAIACTPNELEKIR